MASNNDPTGLEKEVNAHDVASNSVTEVAETVGVAPDEDVQDLKVSPDERAEERPDEKLKWLSGLIGIGTAVLGSFTVFYDKIILPNTTPISIALDLEIKTISSDKYPAAPGGQESHDGLKSQFMVLTASAKNNGPRRLTLIKPHWIVYGINGSLNEGGQDVLSLPRKLAVRVNKGFDYDSYSVKRIQVVRDPSQSGKRLIALGQLFNDVSILPQQVVRSERVVVIPTDMAYQFLEVAVNIPSIPDAISGTAAADIQWKGCLTGESVRWSCDFKDIELSSRRSSRSSLESFKWNNAFCEIAPFSERGELTRLKRPRDILNLFSIRTYYKSESGPKPSLHDVFCQHSGVIFSKDRMDRIGAQVHTATREVPLGAVVDSGGK